MKTILLYLLQVIISSGILYGYYHFFLRNKKFHQYNRFYLLTIPLLSLIIPFLEIPVYFNSVHDIPTVYQILSPIKISNRINSGSVLQFFTWQMLTLVCYGLIAGVIFVRFTIALLKLRNLLKKYKAIEMDNICFVNTDEKGTPFSFFHWLFWNSKISLDSANGQKIFRHELFHIQQKHSWDIVCVEILTILCWINPFFHLVKKEIKTIHEFLADQFAAGNEDRCEYAELLIMQTLRTQQRLVNPFFHNQIKRRIAMLTNSSKTSREYMRKVLVLPLFVFTVSLITISCRTENDIKQSEPEIVEVEIKADQQNQVNKPLNSEPSTEKGIAEMKIEEVIANPQIEPAFKGSQVGWRSFLQKNLNPMIPVNNGAPAGTYTVMTQFLVDVNGDISNLRALTKHGYGMEEEVLRVMANSPKWEPAIHNGIKIKAFRKQTVTFQIQEE